MKRLPPCNGKKRKEITMDKLLEILEEIHPGVDYENCKTLIDDKILTSFDILSIVDEINDAFDVRLTPAEIIPKNFNSAEALWNMIQELKSR